MTPEGQVKRQITRMLDDYGERIYRFMPVQTGYGRPSLDFLLCVDGLFVTIEAKVKGKRPTPRQEATMEDIRRAGGTCFVVDDDAALAAVRRFIDYVLQQSEAA